MKKLILATLLLCSVHLFSQEKIFPVTHKQSFKKSVDFQDSATFNSELIVTGKGNATQWHSASQKVFQDSLKWSNSTFSELPNFWHYREHANNPLTDFSELPFPTAQNYAPSVAAFNDSLYMCTKTEGVIGILLYKSGDSGKTFALHDTSAIISPVPGTDHAWLAEPVIFLDPNNPDSVCVVWKGSTSGSAPDSLTWFWSIGPKIGFPNNLTFRGSLFTAGDLAAAIGISQDSIFDNAASDLIRVGDTLYYYGYGADTLSDGNTQFFIFLATALNMGDPPTFQKILFRSDTNGVVTFPCVYKLKSTDFYGMFFDARGEGGETTENAEIFSAVGWNLRNFTPNGGHVLTYGTKQWTSRRIYAGKILKNPANNLNPLELDGRNIFQFYVSGSTPGIGDRAGLYYFNANHQLQRESLSKKTAEKMFISVKQDSGLIKTIGAQIIHGLKTFRKLFVKGSGELVRVENNAGGFVFLAYDDYDVRMRQQSIGNGYGGSTIPVGGSIIEGDVGIGTDTPSEKLDVNGAINISDGGYSGVTDGATTPVPSSGNPIIFLSPNWFGWDGSNWRKLNNN